MADAAITRATSIDRLNEDLAREYQAIIVYVIYSQVLTRRVHERRDGARTARRPGIAARAEGFEAALGEYAIAEDIREILRQEQEHLIDLAHPANAVQERNRLAD